MHAPSIIAPWPKIDLNDSEKIMTLIEFMGITKRSQVGVVLQAGMNRTLNSNACERFAELVKEKCLDIQVFAKIDDEEVWPDRIPALRSRTLPERHEANQEITRRQIMDALPSLKKYEQSLESQGIPLEFLTQPQVTSYWEGVSLIDPLFPADHLPEDTTHIINPVNCWPLQQRMQLATHDALRGIAPQALESIAFPKHDKINALDEFKSLVIAQAVRWSIGVKAYQDMTLGKGKLGKWYKEKQRMKVEKSMRKHGGAA